MTSSTCSTCNYEFASRKDLFAHKRVDHGGKAPCPQCGVWVKSVSYHVRDLHDRPIEDVTCNACNTRFQRISALRLHIQKHHRRQRTFSCASCPSTFVYRHELNNHVRDRHQDRHPCPNCERSYSDRSGLWAHNRVQHSGIRAVCPICSERFSNKYALKGHVESIHENRQWSCPAECGKMFKQKSSSTEHYRAVHQGRRHRCAICGKSFTRPDSLSSHKRRLHLQLELGKCGHCDKVLSTRSSLRKHLSTQHPKGL